MQGAIATFLIAAVTAGDAHACISDIPWRYAEWSSGSRTISVWYTSLGGGLEWAERHDWDMVRLARGKIAPETIGEMERSGRHENGWTDALRHLMGEILKRGSKLLGGATIIEYGPMPSALTAEGVGARVHELRVYGAQCEGCALDGAERVREAIERIGRETELPQTPRAAAWVQAEPLPGARGMGRTPEPWGAKRSAVLQGAMKRAVEQPFRMVGVPQREDAPLAGPKVTLERGAKVRWRGYARDENETVGTPEPQAPPWPLDETHAMRC